MAVRNGRLLSGAVRQRIRFRGWGRGEGNESSPQRAAEQKGRSGASQRRGRTLPPLPPWQLFGRASCPGQTLSGIVTGGVCEQVAQKLAQKQQGVKSKWPCPQSSTVVLSGQPARAFPFRRLRGCERFAQKLAQKLDDRFISSSPVVSGGGGKDEADGSTAQTETDESRTRLALDGAVGRSG
jgi:hypothetical protein